MKKYLMEGIGAFFLTLTFAMAAHTDAAKGMAPLAIGSILTALVFAGGHISGAHYNPAVSLAVLMRRKLDRLDFPYYWLAQFVGAILAAFIASFLLRCSGVSDIPMRANDAVCALVAEFLGAFILVLVSLSVSTTQSTLGNSYFGLAIGLAQFAGMFVLGPISGGYFNPAVVLGLSIAGMTAWSDVWMYGIGALLGAAAAASVFRVLYGDQS